MTHVHPFSGPRQGSPRSSRRAVRRLRARVYAEIHWLPDGVRTSVVVYKSVINPMHFAITIFYAT